MGGGQAGPSKKQIKAQQEHEAAMMQMNMQLNQQQQASEQKMLQEHMKFMEQERIAAQRAAREATIQGQSTAAQQVAQANAQQVAQQVEGKNIMQQLADQQALTNYNKALTAGAENVTGSYDMGKAQVGAAQQLGQAAGMLPQTQQNLLAKTAAINPAATTAGQINTPYSSFASPSTKGLIFGGA